MYNEYDPVWDKGRCFHPAEIRALTDRAESLQVLGVSEAAGVVALGKDYYATCEALRSKLGNSPTCPFSKELADMDEFTMSDASQRLLQEEAIRRGKERRPVTLTSDQEVIAGVIDALTEDVYHSISQASGRPHHGIRQWPGACVEGAYLLQQRLRAVGIETQVQRYFKPPFFCHFSLVTQIPELTEQLRADNTWQQMMEKEGTDYDSLPHTLIAPVSQTADAIAALGVPDQWAGVWEESKPCPTGWWEYQSKPLNLILNKEGWYDRAMPRLPQITHALDRVRPTTEDPVLDGINQLLETLPPPVQPE